MLAIAGSACLNNRTGAGVKNLKTQQRANGARTKRGALAFALAAVAVALTFASPSVANAITYSYYTAANPGTPLAWNQGKNSITSTHAGGKGIVHSTFGATFEMRTVIPGAAQTVVGSMTTGDNVRSSYTHTARSNTYVTCWWTYKVHIDGTAGTECARGY